MSTSGPPTLEAAGPLAWLRDNLFSSRLNAALTLLILGLLAWLLPPILDWLIFKAVWGPQPVAACDAVRGQGACWAVVWEKFRFMMFGVYPFEQQWRPALVVVVLTALLVISAIKAFWRPMLGVIWAIGIASGLLADGRRISACRRFAPNSGVACRSPSSCRSSALPWPFRWASCWRWVGAVNCRSSAVFQSPTSRWCAVCR